jgi:hypothetical protein
VTIHLGGGIVVVLTGAAAFVFVGGIVELKRHDAVIGFKQVKKSVLEVNWNEIFSLPSSFIWNMTTQTPCFPIHAPPMLC